MTEDTQTSDIHIPTVEEIAGVNQAYGLLYSDRKLLEYYDLGSGETYIVLAGSPLVNAVFAAKDAVYYNINCRTKAIFDNLASDERKGRIKTIVGYHNRIIDSGSGGTFDSLENRMLFSEEEMKEKDVEEFISFAVSPDGKLYGLGNYFDKYFPLIEINTQGQPSLGETIFSWYSAGDEYSDFLLLPWGSFEGDDRKKYDFSILSCVNMHCLDLNGRMIKGSRLSLTQQILKIRQLNLWGNQVDLAISGKGLNQIVRMKIDLARREVIKKETLIDKMRHRITALDTVKSKTLHERLIERGKLTRG